MGDGPAQGYSQILPQSASEGGRASFAVQDLADGDQDMETVPSAYSVQSALLGLQWAGPLHIKSLDPGAQGSSSFTHAFIIIVFSFKNRASLCSPGWPVIGYPVQANTEFTEYWD